MAFSLPEFEELRKGAAPLPASQLAVIANLMSEHRLSAARHEAFERSLRGNLRSPHDPVQISEGVRDCLQQYQGQAFYRLMPQFAEPQWNANNLLATDEATRKRLGARVIVNPDTSLIHVSKLYKLTDVGLWGRHELKNSIFDGFPDTGGPATVNRWLDVRIKRYGIERFLTALCESYNARLKAIASKNYPEQKAFPGWVVPYAGVSGHVERLSGKEPDSIRRLVQSLGIEIPEGGWLAVLQYKVRDAGRLARPTTLEAGYHGIHCPSPPTKPARRGGCIMPLGDEEQLLPEFVHPPMHWRKEFIVGLYKCPSVRLADLKAARSHHLRRLSEVYPCTNHPAWPPFC